MQEDNILLAKEGDLLLAQEGDLLVAQEEDLLLAEEEALPLAQEKDFLLAQEGDKEWSPEKLKMVKKHFFPELSRDLLGVICYHHWYLRAGSEGQKKHIFSKKVLRFKMM